MRLRRFSPFCDESIHSGLRRIHGYMGKQCYIKDAKTRHMKTELNQITDYDKDKLSKVINQYQEWYMRNMEKNARQSSQAAWAYAIHDIEAYIDKNMVHALSTLEETQGSEEEVCFPVSDLFSDIDSVRKELRKQTVHPTLSEKEPALLMDILNKLEICTRRVIQNTSIARLHKKIWVYADALHDLGGSHALSGEEPPSVRSTSHPEVDIVKVHTDRLLHELNILGSG